MNHSTIDILKTDDPVQADKYQEPVDVLKRNFSFINLGH